MNLHQIQQALRQLRVMPRVASERVALRRRIAVRWLEANEAALYDRMIRLQVLEGVAGVPFQRWFGKDLKGLQLAREHFTESGDIDIIDEDPQRGWLATGNTGAFGLLKGILIRFFEEYTRGRGVEIKLDVLDTIHNGLFGVPMEASKEHTNVKKLYSAGKEKRANILAGQETPQKFMSGIGSKGFQQIIQSEVSNLFRHRQIDTPLPGETGLIEGLAAKPLDPDDKWGYLAMWMTSPNDPIGKALRRVAEKAWRGWKKGEEPMTYWLDQLVKTKRAPRKIDMAERLGIDKGGWLQSYWVPGWAKFNGELRTQSRLLQAMEDRLLGLGFTDVDFSLNKIPKPTDISPKRVKGVRQRPKVKLSGKY